MPRLTLDLPDELRPPRGPCLDRRSDGEPDVAADRRAATADDAGVEPPVVTLWHRCWAGDDDQ